MHPHDACFKCGEPPFWHDEGVDHDFIPHPSLMTKERLRAKAAYETYQRELQKAYPDEMVGSPEPWDSLDVGEHEAWLAVVQVARAG